MNSFHNYAVNNITDKILVSATNEDGMIKAIEHKKYQIYGQMWHPERENTFDEHELKLIKKMIND